MKPTTTIEADRASAPLIRTLAAEGKGANEIGRILNLSRHVVARIAGANGIALGRVNDARANARERSNVHEPAPPPAWAHDGEKNEARFGGYVRAPFAPPGSTRMVWKPGTERVPFTVPPGWKPPRVRIEYNPPPLASLGEPGAWEVPKGPVAKGEKRISPSWGAGTYVCKPGKTTKHAEMSEEEAMERTRRKRVAKIAKPSKRAAEVPA